MSLTLSSVAAPFSPDSGATRDPRVDGDASATPFAEVLAGAMAAPPPQPKAAEQRSAGTSELDGADDSNDATEASPGASATSKPSERRSAPLAPPTGVDGVIRDIALLNPELQARLARVAERVRDETGHDLQISETYRTQSRQNALFAQGRDTTGPVVTWTRNSLHTAGRAVDVVLDDGTAPPSAYATLQRIATEEGLHTLGARDPGHLELSASATTRSLSPGISASGAATALTPATSASAGLSLSRLANVASIESVTVAANAQRAPGQVAGVAIPAVAAPAPVARPAAVARPAQPAVVAAVARPAARESSDQSNSQGSGTQNSRDNPHAALALGFDNVLGSRDGIGGGADFTTRLSSLSSTDRALRLLDAQDAAPPRPVSQITMALDNMSGPPDRVQLSLRGNSLATSVDTADPRAAQQMVARADELVRTLNRGGLEVNQLRIRALTDTATAATAAGSVSAAQTPGGLRYDRGNSSGNGPGANSYDSQRPRDDRRQQQRDQRGGKDK